MSVLYKYCDHYAHNVVRDLELKITPPNEFNDPFEFTPQMINTNSTRRFKQVLKDKREMRAMYEKQKRDGEFLGNFRAFRRQLKLETPELLRLAQPKLPKVLEDVRKEYLDAVSTTYGLLCMSKRRDSILMWGHYADRHCGFVLGFKASADVFHIGTGMQDVRYVRDRAVFDSNWRAGSAPERRFADSLLLSKNVDWSYEREARQLFILVGLRRSKLTNGRTGFFYSFPPEALVSITAGPRCDERRLARLLALLNHERFTHVTIDRCRLHESAYELVFESIRASAAPG